MKDGFVVLTGRIFDGEKKHGFILNTTDNTIIKKSVLRDAVNDFSKNTKDRIFVKNIDTIGTVNTEYTNIRLNNIGLRYSIDVEMRLTDLNEKQMNALKNADECPFIPNISVVYDMFDSSIINYMEIENISLTIKNKQTD